MSCDRAVGGRATRVAPNAKWFSAGASTTQDRARLVEELDVARRGAGTRHAALTEAV